MDYTLFYKNKYNDPKEFGGQQSWDLFVSAYNDSERVRTLFYESCANEKHWLILPECQYEKSEYPNNGLIFSEPEMKAENEFISRFFQTVGVDFQKRRLCVDITGFMRPQLIFLVRFLASAKVKVFDAIYTDPVEYPAKEKTIFTKDSVEVVRQIAGCEGNHIPDSSNDLLVIGSGYDDKLIASVAENKAKAKKIQLFGLPSLQPDMYQQNLLRAHRAEEAIGSKGYLEGHRTAFAPANDPFVTAQVLSDLISRENENKHITNLYLSPLSTKAQTLGFALYYVWECVNAPASIIFPFCGQYSRETSKGVAKIWKYTVELP